MRACYWGHAEVVKILLKAGADGGLMALVRPLVSGTATPMHSFSNTTRCAVDLHHVQDGDWKGKRALDLIESSSLKSALVWHRKGSACSRHSLAPSRPARPGCA